MILNIYSLGEVVTSIGFCDDIGVCGRSGTTQTNWNRDDINSTEPNMYVWDIIRYLPYGHMLHRDGSHSAYLEHWI
ncbi:hypothetical protein EDC04DRAFT_1921784 [Pisolithus marmoratus]|nr:hypothetical protein EDC04DRAFT_1921784 [Pisolithus marmoratus]